MMFANTHSAPALVGMLLVTGAAWAEPPGSEHLSTGASEDSARVVKMTLYPAAAPIPALRYTLLPQARDLRPGNAALLYQRAHSGDWWINFWKGRHGERLDELLE